MTKEEALKLALEAMEAETNPSWDCNSYHPKIWNAITTIKEALAQPPQRTWVGLTDEEICMFSMWLDSKSDATVFTAIEARLKELNT
jgi:hypothetical protein